MPSPNDLLLQRLLGPAFTGGGQTAPSAGLSSALGPAFTGQGQAAPLPSLAARLGGAANAAGPPPPPGGPTLLQTIVTAVHPIAVTLQGILRAVISKGVSPPTAKPQQPADEKGGVSLSGVISGGRSVFAGLVPNIDKVIASTGGLSTALGAAGIAVGVVTTTYAAAKGAVSGLIRSFEAPIEMFQRLTSQMRPFVTALNPALMQWFDREMRNAAAAIGTLFAPAMSVAARLVNQFNGVITAFSAAIRPAVQSLTSTFATVGEVFVNSLGAALTAAAPLVELFAGAMKAAAPAIEGFFAGVAGLTAVLTDVVRAVLASFGLGIQSVGDQFRDTIRAMTFATLRATVGLLQFADWLLGGDLAGSFARAAADALAPSGQGAARTTAAVTNPQIGGVPDYANTVARNALLAGPGGAASKDAEEKAWREAVAESLREMAKQRTEPLLETISRKVGKILEKLADPRTYIPPPSDSPLNPLWGARITGSTGPDSLGWGVSIR